MKKTSRRNFGKSMARTLAVLPLASLTAKEAAKAQTSRQERRMVDDNRSHENTPPPIEVQDGSFSLVIRTAAETAPIEAPTSGPGSSNPYLYKGKVPGSSDNNIEHIKILDGAGEWIYRDLEAASSNITIELQDYENLRVGTLEISGERDFFKVQSRGYGSGNADGRLPWVKENGRPRHKHHFTHQGGPGNKEFRVTGIRITKGGATTLNLAIPPVGTGHPFDSVGYRILIWLRE